MKTIKLLPVVVVLASVLLSACSGPGVSLLGQDVAAVSNAISQALATSTAPAQAPAASNLQAPADVTGLQSAYEAVFQNVNPSVVTIEIGSRASNLSGSGGFSFGGPGNGQN